MNDQTIARTLILLIQVGLISALIFFCWSLLFCLLFVVYRRRQIHKPAYDAATRLPIEVAVTYVISAGFGIILPMLLFLIIRGNILSEFTQPINSPWKVALAAGAMIWLAARLLEAAFNTDRPRFSGWVDRIASATGVFVYLHDMAIVISFGAQFATVSAAEGATNMGYLPLIALLIALLVPLLCLLGTTLVYLLAFMETFRPSILVRRHRKPAWGIALAAVVVAFSPLWLSLPRVTHRAAMDAIETHVDLINNAAAAAELDPRLLAGVIYVAQTRDRPRLTFDIQCKIRESLNQERDLRSGLQSILPDPAIGILPLRVGEQIEILNHIEKTTGFGKYALDFATTNTMTFQTVYENNWSLTLDRKVPDALIDMIQSNPGMDWVFNSYIERYEQYLKSYCAASMERQWDARVLQLVLPMTEYTWDLIPAQQNWLCYFSLTDEIMVEVADVDAEYPDTTNFSILNYMPLFHDRRCLLPRAEFASYHKGYHLQETFRIVDNDEMNVLLGAAMLKLLDEEAGAQTSGYEHLLRIAFLSPYTNPGDFARRLEKIMHSPEFDRLFGSAYAAKKEAAR